MKKITLVTALVIGALTAQSASAAIALDRTRAIFDGKNKSLSLNIENRNKTLPYLAQSWVEDAQGKKITTPLLALPPIQRVEPGAKSQIKLQGMDTALHALPQDRETLYYFNLREIPPKSNKANTLQIALQTRIKLFYRPEAIAINTSDTPPQERLTLSSQGGKYEVNNPTPYYVTLISAARSVSVKSPASFKPILVPPRSKASLGVSPADVGNAPVLTYINDFGGRPQLIFNCGGGTCKVNSSKQG